ncbi:hypothetical protein [Kitasatospora sp. P5_F3]
MSALEYARQWSKLPAAHFKIAMGALEKEMEREHAERMRALELQGLAEQRKHRAELTGMAIGGTLSLGSLALTGILAQSHPLIAGITGFGGSATLVTLVAMFVLKRSPSTADLKLLSRQQAPIPTQQPAAAAPPTDPAAITQP